MNTAAVFFSPTGGSEKTARSIAEALSDGKYECVDITPVQNFPFRTFSSEDMVVFSVPCYKGRVPEVAVRRLAAFRGKDTPCIIAVTYGNRDYDDALLELFDLVTAQGFRVEGAAALVGQHTFGSIQVGRPDAQDAAENHRFVENLLAARKAGRTSAMLQISGQRPYRGEGTGAGFVPLTSPSCSRCGLCVRECPVGAIHDDCHTIDGDRCLSCFRCIRICPEKAKHMNVEPYLSFAREFSLKLRMRRENEYFY